MDSPPFESFSRVLSETIGPLFVSAIIGGALQGVIGGQAIYYFKYNKADPLVMKCLVLFVWVLNILHYFLVVDAIFIYTVNGHGDPSSVSRLTWSDIAIVLVSDTGDLAVKSIFSYRVWRLSRQWYLSVAIMTGALVTFSFSLYLTITMIQSPSVMPNAVGTFGALITLAISDIIMSVILAMVFWKRRSVFPTVNRVLRMVILYSLETSLVTR
ncbi:uncharacterized protein B0H18DRAFT_1120378 [Fomitopsis serialis]|uniref:uncharacterized protein n=1 Tax=Fomitopsis serialis TaxID=139415 RepID=UPI00200746EF|nr:uncharacterized protein B0H18DRAFT_1120378 [Neoantrodia serialis]KAH9923525.1 hypothetical protein B0H18DRAFT_1120378 [Neoantrodia serialis]